jgi:hypothetical protein
MTDEERQSLIVSWASCDASRVREFLITLTRLELISAVLLLLAYVRAVQSDDEKNS